MSALDPACVAFAKAELTRHSEFRVMGDADFAVHRDELAGRLQDFIGDWIGEQRRVFEAAE